MATLTTRRASIAGTIATPDNASGGGDKFDAGPNTGLLIFNGDSTSTNVTIAVPGNDKYGQARPDIVIAVAAGVTKLFGPADIDLEDKATDRLVAVTYSKVTSLKVSVLEIV